MHKDYRRLAIATALGTLMSWGMACGGGSTPTAPTPANVAGSYDLTITASSTCSGNLPSETRVLQYVANVTQTGAAVQVTLQGHVIFNSVTISGTVSGQAINFSTFAVNEITESDGVVLTTTGTANVGADGSINGILSGTYQTTSGTNCNTGSHQIQMVKR